MYERTVPPTAHRVRCPFDTADGLYSVQVINKHAVKSCPFGGRDVTEYLKRQLQQQYDWIELSDAATHEVVRQMKEDLCYCGEPPEKQRSSFICRSTSFCGGGRLEK